MITYRCARCGRGLNRVLHKVDLDTGRRYCLACVPLVRQPARLVDESEAGR